MVVKFTGIMLVRTFPVVKNTKEVEKARQRKVELHDMRESKSLESVIRSMSCNMGDKFDAMGEQLDNVNRNVEELQRGFETLSHNDKYIDQRFDTLENGVKRKLDFMENRIQEKSNNQEFRVQQAVNKFAFKSRR